MFADVPIVRRIVSFPSGENATSSSCGALRVGADHRRELGSQDFHRNFAVVLDVLREVDRRHSARAELALDSVTVGERGGKTVEVVVHRAQCVTKDIYGLTIPKRTLERLRQGVTVSPGNGQGSRQRSVTHRIGKVGDMFHRLEPGMLQATTTNRERFP